MKLPGRLFLSFSWIDLRLGKKKNRIESQFSTFAVFRLLLNFFFEGAASRYSASRNV